MDEQLLSVEDFAVKFNISKPTVYRWLKSGKLAGIKVGGQWRFDPSKVRKAFLDGDLAADSQGRSDRSLRGIL